MAVQTIRLFGDPVLRTPAAPVETFDKELRKLVQDLTDTMRDAPGSGLAAPQIGVSLRVFTWWVDDELGHLCNPVLDLSDETQEGDEGCLSIPDLAFDTTRARRVVAKGMNMHGEPMTVEGSDLLARALQHETDHLDGILFIDRLDAETRKEAMKAIREADAIAAIADAAPDCCPVVAYGALLPPSALAIPAHGWINLHFSLLPRWRGAAPVQHAIRAGDIETGATTFRIDEGLDTGPILLQERTRIGEHDTSGVLLERMAVSGAALLVATLDGLEDGTLTSTPQPEEGVTLAPRIDVDDARIDWSAPADVVDRIIRASTPAPGGWTTLRGARLRLGPVDVAEETDLAPGELRAGKREVLVGTGSTAVRLDIVIAEGKRPMAAADWARGLRLEPGEAFA